MKEYCFLNVSRVSHSTDPNAFHGLFKYLNNDVLIKDKDGNKNSTVIRARVTVSYCFTPSLNVDLMMSNTKYETFKHMHACTYTLMHAHTHASNLAHMHVHTHTHTHIQIPLHQ